VKPRPIATGSVDWKTIAPVMLPSASESLPSRIQKKLFAFSGNSVANGARTSASSSGSRPTLSATCSTCSTKISAPPTIAPIATKSCSTTVDMAGGSPRVRSMISGFSSSSDSTSPLWRSVQRA
jgi:hypothetical protein